MPGPNGQPQPDPDALDTSELPSVQFGVQTVELSNGKKCVLLAIQFPLDAPGAEMLAAALLKHAKAARAAGGIVLPSPQETFQIKRQQGDPRQS